MLERWQEHAQALPQDRVCPLKIVEREQEWGEARQRFAKGTQRVVKMNARLFGQRITRFLLVVPFRIKWRKRREGLDGKQRFELLEARAV